MCEFIIKLGKNGVETAGLAAKLATSKQVLHEWVNTHPEFAEAFKESRALCEQYWLDIAAKRARGGKGSDKMLAFLLAACHGYSTQGPKVAATITPTPNPDGSNPGPQTKIEVTFMDLEA